MIPHDTVKAFITKDINSPLQIGVQSCCKEWVECRKKRWMLIDNDIKVGPDRESKQGNTIYY